MKLIFFVFCLFNSISNRLTVIIFFYRCLPGQRQKLWPVGEERILHFIQRLHGNRLQEKLWKMLTVVKKKTVYQFNKDTASTIIFIF